MLANSVNFEINLFSYLAQDAKYVQVTTKSAAKPLKGFGIITADKINGSLMYPENLPLGHEVHCS